MPFSYRCNYIPRTLSLYKISFFTVWAVYCMHTKMMLLYAKSTAANVQTAETWTDTSEWQWCISIQELGELIRSLLMSLGLKPTWMVTLYVTLTSSLSYNCRLIPLHAYSQRGRRKNSTISVQPACSCNAGCMLAACTKALSTQERARWNYPETMGVRASEHAQSVYLTLWRCVHFSAIQYLNLTRKWIHAARKWFQFTHT